jgi:hypothetical protein
MTQPERPTADPVESVGPLTLRVLEYERAIKRLVAGTTDQDNWTSLAEFVAVEDFERLGTFLEVQDWGQYTTMLTQWASATESFETTVRRISEVGDLVYYEIEERHFRGNKVNVINSMTVFEFDTQQKIRRLNVYLQQAA